MLLSRYRSGDCRDQPWSEWGPSTVQPSSVSSLVPFHPSFTSVNMPSVVTVSVGIIRVFNGMQVCKLWKPEE